jgi:hypothetical protein
MATPPLPFRTSTQYDRSRPSNSAVPRVKTVKPPHHAGAAMFMKSKHGCGNSAGPSLELEASLSQKLKGSAGSPGLKHPGALGRHIMPLWSESQLNRYDNHMLGIYLAYHDVSWHIYFLTKVNLFWNDVISPALIMIGTCQFCVMIAVSFFFFLPQ